MALEEKKKSKVEITRDMLIGEIIQAKPESINIFLSVGMGCIACPSSLYESLDEACMVHGLDPNYLLEELNK
jgi:hybrid cluster-associated redox disulfide protein